MRILFMGPPGAGKGTQAALVATALGLPAISSGDIFRSHVADLTPLGREAARYINAGEYVPDQITNEMIRDRLHQPDAQQGWLLDGYPRTLAQVKELDRITSVHGHRLDAVVALSVNEDQLIRRLAHRAAEQGRSDDTEDVIRHRQRLYKEETSPLLCVYEKRGLLRTIDGSGEVGDVTQRLLATLADGLKKSST